MRENLTAKQTRAIAALLQSPTLREAAESCGVPESTLFRWLNEQTFKDAFDQARGQLLQGTLTALQAISCEAVGVLREIMNSGASPAGVRVRAAAEVIGLALRAKGEIEIENRLRTLEDAAAMAARKKVVNL